MSGDVMDEGPSPGTTSLARPQRRPQNRFSGLFGANRLIRRRRPAQPMLVLRTGLQRCGKGKRSDTVGDYHCQKPHLPAGQGPALGRFCRDFRGIRVRPKPVHRAQDTQAAHRFSHLAKVPGLQPGFPNQPVKGDGLRAALAGWAVHFSGTHCLPNRSLCVAKEPLRTAEDQHDATAHRAMSLKRADSIGAASDAAPMGRIKRRK
jgi:hypothetical protein